MQMRQNAISGLVAAAVLALPVAGTAGQEPAGRREIAVTETRIAELRGADEMVDGLARNDELVLASRTPDRYLPERVHEGFMQYHEGVPVVGGGVSRQLAGGVAVSIFGTLHERIDVDTTPLVPADDALGLIEAQSGAGPATNESPSLVILPTLLGTYALVWRMPMTDGLTYFLDAHSGRIVHHERNFRHQSSSVGVGIGIQGQRKKLSTSSAGGVYQAYDRLRPAEIVTLDMRQDEERSLSLVFDPGGGWLPSDVASDADNDWSDEAVVDAHAYEGFTYDYLALQQGWHGLDGRNGRIMSMVNVEGFLFDSNAIFAWPPSGPEGNGVVAFGRWPDGTPLVSADIVAHEMMHGVTHFSVSERTGDRLRGVWRFPGPSEFTLGNFTPRCGESYAYPEGWAAPELTGVSFSFACDEEGRLYLYGAHGGAIDEAISDIIGTAVEFMLHEPATGPLTADYLLGEDTGRWLRRSDDPSSVPLSSRFPLDIRYPDALSGMIWFLVESFEFRGRDWLAFSRIGTVDGGRTLTWLPSWDYGGLHWNSTILSHAFYLAVEGGQNRTTGITVQGVGGANRHDVERAFFRAMTDLMPNSSHIGTAAAVIVQSAADLFGIGSPAHQAIAQALIAVGLLEPAAG